MELVVDLLAFMTWPVRVRDVWMQGDAFIVRIVDASREPLERKINLVGPRIPKDLCSVRRVSGSAASGGRCGDRRPGNWRRQRPPAVGAKATFEVERVWRGNVPKRFDVYMWYLASAEAPRYVEKGRSYIVVAKRLEDKRAREGIGLGGSDLVAFTGVPCSGLHTVEEFVRDVGPGKSPIAAVEEKIRR